MNSVRRERATARRAVASMVALSVGAVLALSTAGPALAVEGEAPQERVLQSVDVQMAPDGTLTTIDGTIVQSSGGSEDADTSESEYAPDEVAPALPVRVMTAWRTEDGVGTDLADLDGYDGEIRIDLTVQNLTVKPQNLTYDVEGQSRQQAALVGSPLTVVAAADLGELPADSVVTAGQGPTTDATNGVLGKDQCSPGWSPTPRSARSSTRRSTPRRRRRPGSSRTPSR
jgi:trimeric autotransporter adhesin